MLEIVLNWKPNTEILTQLIQVASQENKSLESLLEDAIAQYLQTRSLAESVPVSPATPDPLIGLYDGSPNLSTEAEAILQVEVQSPSGLSWKK